MVKQSPLSTFHESNGARFVERDGRLLPAQFSNSAAEYAAVRSGVGFIDLSHRGLLQLTGADRVSFLQGMVSNDVKALKPGEGQYATILNQQGKVLGDTRVLCSENSLYLDLWEIIKDKIAGHLNRYLVADEVEIADRTDEYGIISLQGPQAEACLQRLVGQNELPGRLAEHRMVNIDGAQVCVVRASYTGETGFDLIIPAPHFKNIAEQLTETGNQLSGAWVGEEAHNILRVEAGLPLYGIDFTEDNLLLEVGLDHAVSFSKGCYLGQEVVERIRSRGHVNKKLVGLDPRGPRIGESGRRPLCRQAGWDHHQLGSLPGFGQTRCAGVCAQRLLESGHAPEPQTRRSLPRREGHDVALCASATGIGFFLLNPDFKYV